MLRHQNRPRVPLNVRVPEGLRRELRVHYCLYQTRRIEDFVAEAIREALQRRVGPAEDVMARRASHVRARGGLAGGRDGMARQKDTASLHELAHRLRDELWTLQTRGDLAADDAARRRIKLETSLGITRDMLAEIAERRTRSSS